MRNRELRYDADEFRRRGKRIYDVHIREKLESTHHGWVVAIDIESSAYEVARQTLAAADLLFAKVPDAQVWFERVGYDALYHIRARQNEPVVSSSQARASRRDAKHGFRFGTQH
jgi:hypothetical protein